MFIKLYNISTVLYILAFLVLTPFIVSGQTLSGLVQDSLSGEPLVNANIWDAENKKGTSTDEFGRFHLTINEDTSSLIVSYVGYIPDTLLVQELGGKELNIRLQPAAIDEVTISSHRV